MLTMSQRDKTLRALQSVRDDDPQIPVLLWDNGSTDDTIDAVAGRFPDVHAHRHPTNLGVASGRNAGARLAIKMFQPTHLLFLDNDLGWGRPRRNSSTCTTRAASTTVADAASTSGSDAQTRWDSARSTMVSATRWQPASPAAAP
jgi:hypothetical protein